MDKKWLSSLKYYTKFRYFCNIYIITVKPLIHLGFILAFDGQDKSVPILKILQKSLFNHPPHGMTSRVQVTVKYRSYSVYVLMKLWKEGQLESVDDVYELCNILGNKSKHKFCPGIDCDYCEREYYQAIGFIWKVYARAATPFQRLIQWNVNSCLFLHQMQLLQRRKQVKWSVQPVKFWSII